MDYNGYNNYNNVYTPGEEPEQKHFEEEPEFPDNEFDKIDTEKYEECCKHKKVSKKIEVEEVLGTGEAETNFEVCIPVVPPAFEILENLEKKTIEFDNLIATDGKVFINARLIKNIPFKTKIKTLIPTCKEVSKIVFGDIRHVTVEIPFSLCIDIPKAFKGAKVVVLNTEIDSVDIPNFISCKSKIIKSITEKDCVRVKVKVVKDKVICVPANEC